MKTNRGIWITVSLILAVLAITLLTWATPPASAQEIPVVHKQLGQLRYYLGDTDMLIYWHEGWLLPTRSVSLCYANKRLLYWVEALDYRPNSPSWDQLWRHQYIPAGARVTIWYQRRIWIPAGLWGVLGTWKLRPFEEPVMAP